jgi:hypothetical protein
MDRSLVVSADGKYRSGKVCYDSDELSLWTLTERNSAGRGSLLLNTVQLEVADDGTIDEIWGYNPERSWTRRNLNLPKASTCKIWVRDYLQMERGVGYRVEGEWIDYFDETNQLLCIDSGKKGQRVVKVLSNAFLEIDAKGMLSRVWIELIMHRHADQAGTLLS